MEQLTFQQREILKRAEEILLSKDYKGTCLDAFICPECGGDIYIYLKPGCFICTRCQLVENI